MHDLSADQRTLLSRLEEAAPSPVAVSWDDARGVARSIRGVLARPGGTAAASNELIDHFLAVYGVLFGPWNAGSAIFMYHGRFEPEKELRLLEKYEINVFCAPPTEYRLLVKEDLSRFRLSRLRLGFLELPEQRQLRRADTTSFDVRPDFLKPLFIESAVEVATDLLQRNAVRRLAHGGLELAVRFPHIMRCHKPLLPPTNMTTNTGHAEQLM